MIQNITGFAKDMLLFSSGLRDHPLVNPSDKDNIKFIFYNYLLYSTFKVKIPNLPSRWKDKRLIDDKKWPLFLYPMRLATYQLISGDKRS